MFQPYTCSVGGKLAAKKQLRHGYLEDFPVPIADDYCDNRDGKLLVADSGIAPNAFSHDFQSWARKSPTVKKVV
jgi:hypothetical protein